MLKIIGDKLIYHWDYVLDVWLVLKPCRFSLISLLAGFIFFVWSQQGIDILRVMIESESLYEHTLFYFSVVLWAFSIWYWARYALSYDHIRKLAINSENIERSNLWISRVPVILGVAAFATVMLAFFFLESDYPDDTFKMEIFKPGAIASIYLVSIIGYLFIVTYIGPKVSATLVPKLKSLIKQDFTGILQAFPWIAKYFVPIGIVITFLAFLGTTLAPVSTGEFLGTPNLLLIAAANAAFVGTMLVVLGEYWRLPIFTIMLLMAIVFSLWNDNHDIQMAGEFKNNIDPRKTIDDHFTNWLETRYSDWERKHKTSASPDNKFPLFIVAAEGGGIRAAYWSASLLGALQDSNPDFASHIYAMSGVSGGSLGIATFASLLKASRDEEFSPTEKNKECFPDNKLSYQKCAEAVLSEDFLAPVVGRMLYGDLLQRFLPWPVKSFDRGHAIELAWEQAWSDLTNTKYFSEPMLSIYDNCNKKQGEYCAIPALLLNSTWVERGRRVISSNIKIEKEHFITTYDLHDVTKRHIPLSSAVHNSARFSYVSPAGTVKKPNGEVVGHLIDGGYFENSGATAALELLHHISSTLTPCSNKQKQENSPGCKTKANLAKKWKHVKPVIIMLTNDPRLHDDEKKEPHRFMNELRSPVAGLLNTRGGRGSYSREALQYTVEEMGGEFVEFGLHNIKNAVPLGWMLSDRAKNTMENRLLCYDNGEKVNLLNIRECDP